MESRTGAQPLGLAVDVGVVQLLRTKRNRSSKEDGMAVVGAIMWLLLYLWEIPVYIWKRLRGEKPEWAPKGYERP